MPNQWNGIIKSIHIEKFRKLHNVDIECGHKITALIGQNSSMKTTILGLIAHPFSMYESQNNPHSMDNSFYTEKTLAGYKFESKFNSKFKLDPTKEHPGDHEWTLYFTNRSIGDAGMFTIESIPRKGVKQSITSPIRFWKKGHREAGSGYLHYPVIYLSLKRVTPIGEENKLSDNHYISEEDLQFFNTNYRDILILDENFSQLDKLKSSNKSNVIAHPNEYTALTVSAGQDNLGSILTSILSFKKLKESHPNEYKGGLLFIDELESTLYPAAQEKLSEKLFKFSRDYKIQIFITTHSPTVVETLSKAKYQNDAKIIFMESRDGKIAPNTHLSPPQILNKLLVHPSIPSTKPTKINVYTEDDEARIFLKTLLPSKYIRLINIVRVNIGGDQLKTLASFRNIKEFTDSLIILDGDKISNHKNIICLPGENIGPDHLLYNFLRDLPESDYFWSDEYTRQMCFRNYMNINPNGTTDSSAIARVQYKKWFREQQNYWGPQNKLAYKRWKKSNSELCQKFIESFVRSYNYIASKHSLNIID